MLMNVKEESEYIFFPYCVKFSCVGENFEYSNKKFAILLLKNIMCGYS